MALVLKDRVRVTSTTAGTGAFTLGSAVTGYQDFSVIGTGNTTYYTIADQSGANWEVGLGTYTAPNQLTRTTVYESSNSNNLVDFGSNVKDVFVTFPAEAVTTGGITGSGTANYVPKFTGSTAVGNSVIYDDGTNVGIGTASPLAPLDVALISGAGTPRAIINQTADNPYYELQRWTGTSTDYFGTRIKNVQGAITFERSDGAAIGSQTFTERMRIDSSGNVGIGTSSPAAKLDVAGTTTLGTTGANTITLKGQVSANSSVGTAGQVLTSQGANLPPQWTSVSGSGTVTQVNTSGSVSGITLTGGPITATGTVTLGGSLDLSAPPAIGGTTPNVITGTTITANNGTAGFVLDDSAVSGIIGTFSIDPSTSNLAISVVDTGLNPYQTQFDTGVCLRNGSTLLLSNASNSANVGIYINPSASSYNLYLPTSTGSSNQVLKTDGTGVTSWVNLNAPTIYTTASSQNSTSATLANITGLTATLSANTTYRVDCFVTFQSAATTTGINFGFTSPTGTVCMLEVVVPITNTAAASQLRTIFPNNGATNTGNVLGTGVSTINNNHTARFSGIVKVGGTGGTFAAQYATEIAASAITIPAGSTMVIQQIS